jgi:hypothetical protein
MLSAFIDIFAMMGLTRFCFEVYLGTIFRDSLEYTPRAWIVGFIANLVIGGVIGILYGVVFESYFYRANARVGALLGLGHAAVAALAIFPFFEVVREQLGLRMYNFGFFGFGINVMTPLLLLVGHVMFGVTMGTFYGAVGARRVRTRDFEPDEELPPGDRRAVSEEEDPQDRLTGWGAAGSAH